jgi:energy-coupling factor transport system permease protein
MNTYFINKFNTWQRTGNFWCDLNPLTKLNMCVAFALSALFVHDYRFGIVLIAGCMLMALFAGKFKPFFDTFGPVSFTVIVFITLIRQIGMRTGNVTPMFTILGWTWYKEAFIDGLNTTTFIMAFSGWFTVYFVTTPMYDLMYTLEQKGMSHENSFIMLSSMQNIIDLRKASVVILESQKSRGIEAEGNIFVRAKAFFPTLGPLILSAIASTEEKAIAMDARAFSVNRKHTFLREIAPLVHKEKLMIVAVWIFCAATLVYRIYPLVINLFS